MKKEQPKQKNPARVAAAKRAAANRVRIDGKFTTKYFQKELERAAEKTGFKGSPQTFFDQNEIVYSKLYNEGSLRSVQPKADSTIFNEINKFSGKLYIRRNGEDIQVTPDEMRYEMLRFEQFLMSSENCAGMAFKPVITFNGRYIIEIPDIDDLEGEEMTGDDLQDLMEQGEGVVIYISSKRKDKIVMTAKGADRRQNKKNQINKRLKDAKPKRAKGRTKPRQR